MKIGSLVTPAKHWVELSPESDLHELAGRFEMGELGVVVEEGCHPRYKDPEVRVLSSSGVLGWISSVHVRKV